jgi:hypothetical protein
VSRLASAFDEGSTLRLAVDAELVAGAGALATTHPVLPAMRATTHVDGKLMLSSSLRESASQERPFGFPPFPIDAGATREPIAPRRTAAFRSEPKAAAIHTNRASAEAEVR